MKKARRLCLSLLVDLIIVYGLACVLGSLWLQQLVIECNTSSTYNQSAAKYFSDESLMNQLDYRLEGRPLTITTFDIQVSMPYFFIGFGEAKARFYVTWNGYEQRQGQTVHKAGVSKQPFDVSLRWQNGHWVIASINQHEFVDR